VVARGRGVSEGSRGRDRGVPEGGRGGTSEGDRGAPEGDREFQSLGEERKERESCQGGYQKILVQGRWEGGRAIVQSCCSL
jgi:hypothetical protein